jgi:benzodiazapine receptor
VRTLRYVAGVVGAAAAGQAATRAGTRDWYPRLRKPAWTPPSWVFGPVWTMLYAQMVYSARRVSGSTGERRLAGALWWLQLGLNGAWSPVFFGAQKPRAGAALACALVPAGAATAGVSARIDRRAGVLYAPYLAWSAFAAVLNLELARLNPAGDVADG